ncbi:MAG: SGNH/GDSL hydrolase family protein [bacterium]
MTSAARVTKSIGKGLLASLVSVAAITLVEIVLRFLPQPVTPFSPGAVLDRQGGLEEIQRAVLNELGPGREHEMRANQIYRDDARTFWRLRRNVVITGKNYLAPREVRDKTPFTMTLNNAGFRGPEIGRVKSTGTLRVIAVGNSSTFGWGVDDDETYPAQLESRLRGRLAPRAVEVMNAGIPGFTTFQGERILESELLPLDPDYVVLSFGFNDSRRAACTDSLFAVRASSVPGRLARAASHLAIYKRLERAIRGANTDRLSPTAEERTTVRVPVEQYESRMKRLVRAVVDAGARPILLAMVIPPPYRDALDRVARGAGIPFLETQPYLRARVAAPDFAATHAAALARDAENWRGAPSVEWRSAAYADGIHPSGLGNELIAEWVANVIATAESSSPTGADAAR